MIGVVLCGGQSVRMSSDKGLLKKDSVTWAQHAFARLSTLSIPVIISVNSKQLVDYSKIFDAENLVTDNESLKIRGPLCGVLSVHFKHPHEDIVVLACDMPLMENRILKELTEQFQQHLHADALVFTNDGKAEPLCGVYTAKALSHIYHLYKTYQLPKHSMKYVLDKVSTFFISLSDDKKQCFTNVNTLADLDGL